MVMTSKAIRTMCLIAGVSVLATTANAAWLEDTKITIDRALNSPTVTVKYSGANAALVELLLNGESVGTRSVSSTRANGETNFTINLPDLKDGDNDVEIRLYDRTGKLIGSDKTNIATDQTEYGPVFLSTPKVGQSVMGAIDIKLGFGRDLKNVYVSFFVDNNFKKMTNFPPYTYSWDTTGETNGWHEVEAWAVDESSNTFKTRKTRVFVNNPGGRTDRPGYAEMLSASKNRVRAAVTANEAGIRDLEHRSTAAAVNAAQLEGAAPKGAGAMLRGNRVRATVVGSASGLKPAPTGTSIAAGSKSLTPTGLRTATPKARTTGSVASAKIGGQSAPTLNTRSTAPKEQMVAIRVTPKTTQGSAITRVAAASNLIRINRGQRLPNLTSFAVVFNSQFVDFDVAPRVEDGVPMAPFRHLLEKAGGTIDWQNMSKSLHAKTADKDIRLQIGDRNAIINKLSVTLEVAPYIDRGRTIVPLSFVGEALNVSVDYDKETGHVLISSNN